MASGPDRAQEEERAAQIIAVVVFNWNPEQRGPSASGAIKSAREAVSALRSAGLLSSGEGEDRDEDSAGAECSRLEDDMLAIHDALEDAGLPGAINADSIIERIRELAVGAYVYPSTHERAGQTVEVQVVSSGAGPPRLTREQMEALAEAADYWLQDRFETDIDGAVKSAAAALRAALGDPGQDDDSAEGKAG